MTHIDYARLNGAYKVQLRVVRCALRSMLCISRNPRRGVPLDRSFISQPSCDSGNYNLTLFCETNGPLSSWSSKTMANDALSGRNQAKESRVHMGQTVMDERP